MTEKQILRKKLIQRRNRLSEKQRSLWSLEIKKHVIRFIQEKLTIKISILIYCSYLSEVETGHLMNQLITDKYQVGLPCIVGKNLIFYNVNLQENWVIHPKYKIKEPNPQLCKKSNLKESLLLVPTLGYNHKMVRIGYGGGYYDRFISQYQHNQVYGLAFSSQYEEEIPIESHDQLLRGVFTERGLNTGKI